MLFGLLGGPILFYLIGTLVVKVRASVQQKYMEKTAKQHNTEISKMNKEYHRQRKIFNKKTIKLQKLLAKAKEAQT